ncbi:MAG: sugar phosphate isomerase/epimerase [Lachnospiraceae bacterium]|nr:sugar phosphate isomerase/epimerase [Lachnospiraceae bacterium]
MKKKKYFRVAAVTVFFLWIGLVLAAANEIVCAKFIGDSTTIVDGFYAEKKNDIDVVVVGSSNSFCTVNPLVLYEEYGIAAYDFGSSSQPMNISELYIKEVLKRQKPKVIALEINMMVGDSIHNGSEAGLRWGYTNIPLSVDKLKCIYQSVGKLDAEYFSYVFPIFRYHNRWKELSKTDYTYFGKDKTNYTKGYLETQSVAEYAINMSDYGYEGETWIGEDNIVCLDEIVQLCQKNNVELLLFKSPKENWHKYETKAIRALADERGLLFIDYNELYDNGELEFDVAADFRDGDHLNDFGAKKVTMHFGDYLKANYELTDRRADSALNSWDRACDYKRRGEWQDFMAAAKAEECFRQLLEDENLVIIVTRTGSEKDSRVQQWVYQNRKMTLHVQWEDNGIHHMKIGKSELVLSKLGDVYQTLIDGVEYYQPESKWNIVVYDKITKSVTANLVFDE